MMLEIPLMVHQRRVGQITVHSLEKINGDTDAYRWVVNYGGKVLSGRFRSGSSDAVVLLGSALDSYRLLRQANDEEDM